MKKLIFTLLFFNFILVSSIKLFSANIEQQMESLAKNIIKSYKLKQESSGVVTLSIIPFKTEDEILKKQHIGFGVSELLTDNIVHYGADTFNVVERTHLENVLAEQKLSLTGIIDENTAIKTGKLLGADHLLIGSVSQVGNMYLVNSRLIKSDTGEILVAESTTFNIKEFKKKAKDYLELPQNWCVYYSIFSFNLEQVRKSEYIPINNEYVKNITELTNFITFGAGFRHIMINHIMFDFQAPFILNTSGGTTISITGGTQPGEKFFSGHAMPGPIITFSFLDNLNKNLRYFLGGGIAEFGTYPQEGKSDKTVFPLLRGGIEFEFKKRIRANFIANYYYTSDKTFYLKRYFGDVVGWVDIPVFKLNPLSVEFLLGFYF